MTATTEMPNGETVRVVSAVPASAQFQFAWNGFHFFTVAWRTGTEDVAVAASKAARASVVNGTTPSPGELLDVMSNAGDGWRQWAVLDARTARDSVAGSMVATIAVAEREGGRRVTVLHNAPAHKLLTPADLATSELVDFNEGGRK